MTTDLTKMRQIQMPRVESPTPRVESPVLVKKEKELLIVGKTMNKNVQKIIKSVKKLHSYEVPCVIFFDIKNGNVDFLKWIIKSV